MRNQKILPGFVLLFVLGSSIVHAQWTKQTNGVPSSITAGVAATIDACDEQTAVVSTGREIYRTVDSGNSWQKLSLSDEVGFIWDISIIDSAHIWVCDGNGKIFATQDAGNNWTLQFSNDTLTKFMNYIEMFDLDNGIAMGDNINSGATPAIIQKTSDGGNNWISVNDSAFGGSSADTWRRLDFVDPNVGYFQEMGINPQKIFKTIDGGKSWAPTNYPEGTKVEVLKFYHENIGLVISNTRKMYRTIDGATTWETINSPNSGWGEDIEFAPDDPSRVWMADQNNLFFSSDTGKTWQTQLLSCKPSDVVFVDSWNGWFVGSNGVYHTNSGGLTPINEKIETQPTAFKLHQNYPNPFNISTKISYKIAEPCLVKLSIFNLLGKEIKNLVNEQQAPGSYEINWTAENLPSGAYFYRLEAGEFKDVKKLIVLK